MMSTKFFPMSFFTAVLFFLSSCNGNENKTNADKAGSDSTTTATSSTVTEAPSTITTTPQGMMLVKHKVANFTKWVASFESNDSFKLASGLHNYVLGRGMLDSNLILVAVKADDMTKAKTFSMNPKLKEAMQKGGVTGPPSFMFMTAVYQDTAVLNTPVRSLTNFKVKDWAVWEKGFKDGKQERLDNGIIERVYGHEPEDEHKVILVTAILDSAKAAAYWKSDMLKKRRAAGGVIGEPERFIFRVAKRY